MQIRDADKYIPACIATLKMCIEGVSINLFRIYQRACTPHTSCEATKRRRSQLIIILIRLRGPPLGLDSLDNLSPTSCGASEEQWSRNLNAYPYRF